VQVEEMQNTEFTVDISTLLRILRKYIAAVIIFTIIGVIIAALLSEVVIPNRYAASAKFYIENRQTQSEVIAVGDITASRNMVNTCAELFSTRDITRRLKERTTTNYSVTELMNMISMGTSNNTEFLTITITASDAWTAVTLLESFVEICIETFNEIIETGRISVVDSAFSTGRPVFPNTTVFVIIGFLLGFVLSYLVVFIIEILDTKVKAEDDLYRIYEIPVFAEVMSFNAKIKGEYNYE
jgi:capsular polysaccharide biosynthesis protein